MVGPPPRAVCAAPHRSPIAVHLGCTVRHHAVEDIEHAKSLARVIDLCEQHARVIIYSAALTARMVGFYLTERMRGAHG